MGRKRRTPRSTNTPPPSGVAVSDLAQLSYDERRLSALFDLVAASKAQLVLWERDEPEAPAALRKWAMRNRLRVNNRPLFGVIGTGHVLEFETGVFMRGILIYCKETP